MTVLGIDLGTERVRAAIAGGDVSLTDGTSPRRGSMKVVVDDRTAISFGSHGVLLGHHAEERCTTHPEETLLCLPRVLGRSPADRASRIVGPGVLQASASGPAVFVQNKTQQTAARMLGTLLSDVRRRAEESAGALLVDAVFVVPALASDARRRNMLVAGEEAGFDVRRLVSAPIAAWLGSQARPLGKILVVDAGAGSVDMAVLRADKASVQVLAVGGEAVQGGADLDVRLTEAMLSAFTQAGGGQVGTSGQARLRFEMRGARESLSDQEQIQIRIPALGGGKDEVTSLFCPMLSQATLEALMAPLLDRVRRGIGELLQEAGLASENLDALVLAGGFSKTPAFKKAVREACGQTTVEMGPNPEHAAALGAGFAAELVYDAPSPDFLFFEANPHAVSVNGVEVIAKNAIIPARSAPLQGEGAAAVRCAGRALGQMIGIEDAEKARVLIDADGLVHGIPQGQVILERT